MGDAEDAIVSLEEELADDAITVRTGPMADAAEREVKLPPTTVVDEVREVAGLGEVHVVAVEMDMGKAEYRFMNDPDNPDQRSPGEAIYTAMDAAGIERPHASPDLGVRVGGPDVDGVLVEGYVPLGEEVRTDGGLVGVGGHLVWLGMVPPLLGMARLLNDLGEEYTIKTNLDAESLDIGLYDDASVGATGDSISDTDDLGDLTTEPSDGNYARQTAAMSAADLSGNWGIDNDSSITFDTTNTTGTVDSWFAEVNANLGGSTADHLVCTGALSQAYDLSNLSQLQINAGGVGWTVN